LATAIQKTVKAAVNFIVKSSSGQQGDNEADTTRIYIRARYVLLAAIHVLFQRRLPCSQSQLPQYSVVSWWSSQPYIIGFDLRGSGSGAIWQVGNSAIPT
jgi:hypothetical protein